MLCRRIQWIAFVCRANYSNSSRLLDFSRIPTPKGLPVIGTVLSLIVAGGTKKLHKYIDERHRELGTIFKDNVGPVTAVFLSDPEEMRSVFAKEGKYPLHIKPEAWLVYNEKHNYTRGLFFMDGEEWLHHRRIMNKLLMKGDLNWIDDCCDSASDLILRKINNCCYQEFPELEKELYKLSMDIIVSILVGARAYREACDDVDHLIENLSNLVRSIFENTRKLQLLPARFADKYNISKWKRFEESVYQSLKAANDIVDNVDIYFKNHDGLIAYMLNEPIEKTEINKIVVDMILGAGDTTSSTMAWMLYLLSKNPDIQTRLRNELNKDPKTPYSKYVLRETLRLYPAAPFLTRFLPEEAIVCGYKIPPYTLIVMSLYTTSRDAVYFKDPLKFIPERWSRSSTHGTVIQQLASMPFGIGSRSCIGRKIAESQLQITINKIIKNYSVRVCNVGEVDMVLELTAKPAEPIRIVFDKV